MKKLEERMNVIAVLLAVLVLVANCRPSGEIKLNAGNNGSQIEIEQGQILVITLEANPTTGYMWEMIESEEQILQQVGEIEFQPDSKLIGAPGIQTLRLEAVNVGQITLNLVYHRPWEENVDPLETFSVQVVVR